MWEVSVVEEKVGKNEKYSWPAFFCSYSSVIKKKWERITCKQHALKWVTARTSRFGGILCWRCSHVASSCVVQFDVASLVPLELFYFKTGINPLLRLPRLLKVAFTSNLYSLWELSPQSLIWFLLIHSSTDQLFLWVQRTPRSHFDQSIHLQVCCNTSQSPAASFDFLCVSCWQAVRPAGWSVPPLTFFTASIATPVYTTGALLLTDLDQPSGFTTAKATG